MKGESTRRLKYMFNTSNIIRMLIYKTYVI